MKEGVPRPEQIQHTESEMTDEQRELAAIREITLEDKGNFLIVSPQETDSSGDYTWESYLDRKKLMDAWTPPPDSPYIKFVKTKTINSIGFIRDRIKPRHSEAELKCEREIENLINGGQLEKGTAIILDSGGAHSVAMATALVKHGFQPVVMLDSIPHSRGITRSEQSLATLLYFAEQMNGLKQKDQIKHDAPPVFILDCHRDSRDLAFGTTVPIINTHTFDEHDLPSSEEFKKIWHSQHCLPKRRRSKR
jgi:hypothetical protein